MKFLLKPAAISFALLLVLSLPLTTAAQVNPRILGGGPLVESQARVMAAILIKQGDQMYFCSGTLVGPSTVLTAAHCHPPGSELTVLINGQSIIPSAVVTNPLFLQTQEERDQAEVTLIDLVKFDLTVITLPEPMPLAPLPIAAGAHLEMGDVVQIAGFGTNEKKFIRTPAGLVKNLRVGQSVVTSVDSFYDDFETAARSRYVNDHKKYSTVCHGDSGGPVFNTVQAIRFMLGVHSAGANPVVDDRCRLGYSGGEAGAGAHTDLNSPPTVDFLEQFDSILWISSADIAAKSRAAKIDSYLRSALITQSLPVRKSRVQTARRLLLRDLYSLTARDENINSVLASINENLAKVSRRAPLAAARQTLKSILSHFAVRTSFVRGETL